MDMNELLRREQIALMHAEGNQLDMDKTVFEELATYYASRIKSLRSNLGVTQY